MLVTESRYKNFIRSIKPFNIVFSEDMRIGKNLIF